MRRSGNERVAFLGTLWAKIAGLPVPPVGGVFQLIMKRAKGFSAKKTRAHRARRNQRLPAAQVCHASTSYEGRRDL